MGRPWDVELIEDVGCWGWIVPLAFALCWCVFESVFEAVASDVKFVVLVFEDDV